MKFYKIVYQKRSGEIIERERMTLPTYAVGEITSMGWKIIDIFNGFQNKWYSSYNYYEYKRAAREYYSS